MRRLALVAVAALLALLGGHVVQRDRLVFARAGYALGFQDGRSITVCATCNGSVP